MNEATSERVSLKQAAAEIGCHPEYLRRQMAAGLWDLGTVIHHRKTRVHTYFIFRPKLDKFLGIKKEGADEKTTD